MTFISRGEVYDDPPYAEVDLECLVANIAIPGLIQMTVDAITAAFNIPAVVLNPAEFTASALLPELPAAAGLSGAGSPVPVSGASPLLPAPRNEMRNE